MASVRASKNTAQATYNAMTNLFPIRSDYSIGFVGYHAINFAADQDHEGIAQYYYQQKWLTTTTRTKLTMAGFKDIDTRLIIQGKITTFRQYMLEAVDSTDNCLLCNIDYTTSGVPVIIYPAANEIEVIKHASGFNRLLIQEYGESTPPTYSMKRVPLGGNRNAADQQHVNALLSRFKPTNAESMTETENPTQAVAQAGHQNKHVHPECQHTYAEKVTINNSSQATVGTDQMTLDMEDERDGIERLLNEVATKQGTYDQAMKTLNQKWERTMRKSIDALIGYQFKAAGQASFTASSISDLRTLASETTTTLLEISVTIQELVKILAGSGIRMSSETRQRSEFSTQAMWSQTTDSNPESGNYTSNEEESLTQLPSELQIRAASPEDMEAIQTRMERSDTATWHMACRAVK